MAAERCEFCGRWGAKSHHWIDPRGMSGKGWQTLWLCDKCWRKQEDWTQELIANMSAEKRERYSLSVEYARSTGYRGGAA